MMRYLMLIVLLAVSGFAVLAQDKEIETITVYYENPNPQHLDHVLVSLNVCLERFLQLNPDLNIQHIEYGQKITIPKNEPCYNGKHQAAFEPIPRLKYYENGQWLDEPYYSENIEYIYPQDFTLDDIAGWFEVCVNDLLAENILLQDFETYSSFTTYTTMDIFIPQGTPSCAPPPNPRDNPDNQEKTLLVINTLNINVSPQYFAETFNFCAEDVAESFNFHYHNLPPDLSIHIPNNLPPCYNEQGQRLSYYDAQGEKRDEPIYSDLPVYVVRSGETMLMIAEGHDICIVDLLRHNGFLDMSVNNDVEIFLPPSGDCQETGIHAIQTFAGGLQQTSQTLNICPDVLLELNPQLRFYDYRNPYNQLNSSPYSNSINHWVIVPDVQIPCYHDYIAQEGETLYEIEQTFNVCHEEFTFADSWRIYGNRVHADNTVIYIPLNHQPCYNELGQRLYYPQDDKASPYYADMDLYFVQHGDNIYRISQQFNICVQDLLTANKALESTIYVGHPVFIPDTLPCYDETTGLPLIYKDENGQLLEALMVAEQLTYYGNESTERLSYYYNVCQNRLEDANRAKLDKEASYLGWIIPMDRPPCFDADWNPIDYVCYTQLIDMTSDYRKSDEVISFDYDGTHCYDLSNPETVVWYENEPYKTVYYQDTLFQSRAFTAWCYGVSLDEIDAINDKDDVLEILPFQARLIPQPTRDCYIDHPQILEQHNTIRVVMSGEALSDIAKEYGIPYQIIALANDLDENNTIWYQQKLIIPDGFTWRGLIIFAGSVSAIGLGIILLYRRKQGHYHKKKRVPKNDSL